MQETARKQYEVSEVVTAGSKPSAVTPLALPIRFCEWKDVARFIRRHGQYPVVNKTMHGFELIKTFETFDEARELLQSNRKSLERAGKANNFVWCEGSELQKQYDEQHELQGRWKEEMKKEKEIIPSGCQARRDAKFWRVTDFSKG